MTAPDIIEAVDQAFRDEWGHLVATLIAATGDWSLAEECAQDAFASALQTWARDGVPRRPGAWLITTARNRAVDRLRRDAVGAAKMREAALVEPHEPPMASGGVQDDRLRLIFTCCHPALALESRVALTLRTLVGLTTAEIGRAFLVPESTMSKRITRAKQKIRNAGIPYRVPPNYLLPQRLTGVLGVIYLLFNEGYTASAGVGYIRFDLCDEAIRLARVLAQLMPEEPEAQALLALLLLHDARRSSRVNDAGDLVLLEDQDRSQWDRGEIAEGVTRLDAAMRGGVTGPYQIQAAIAACHATASRAAETDWPQIAILYAELERHTPSPVVRLNRAIAVGMAYGPEAALAMLDDLEAAGTMSKYHLLPAARAEFLRKRGDDVAAAAAYRRAIELATGGASTDAERRHLRRRLAELT